MRTKRIAAVLLAGVMAMSMLAGCGSKKEPEVEISTNTDASEIAAEMTDEFTQDKSATVTLSAEEIEQLKTADGMDKATASQLGYQLGFEGYRSDGSYFYWILNPDNQMGILYILFPNEGTYLTFKGNYLDYGDGSLTQLSADGIDYEITKTATTTDGSGRECYYIEDANGNYTFAYVVDPDKCISDFYANRLAY